MSKNWVLSWNSIWSKSSYKKGHFTNSFGKGAKCCIFCVKRAFAHFGLDLQHRPSDNPSKENAPRFHHCKISIAKLGNFFFPFIPIIGVKEFKSVYMSLFGILRNAHWATSLLVTSVPTIYIYIFLLSSLSKNDVIRWLLHHVRPACLLSLKNILFYFMFSIPFFRGQNGQMPFSCKKSCILPPFPN